MARRIKVEASALNIRIPFDKDRNYKSLLSAIADLKRGVRVYGDSFVAINNFDEDDQFGIISKYTEINTEGNWFNTDTFSQAEDEEISNVNIPNELKPNLSQFHFFLDESLHSIIFETYSDSKSLSPSAFEKYFQAAVLSPSIRNEFGRIEISVIKSYAETERLLSLPDLKEVRMFIRRPNSDDLGEDLASEIEERLNAEGADEYEESIKVKGSGELTPSERTKKLAIVAAENGHVNVKSIVNGVTLTQGTELKPLIEVDTFGQESSNLSNFVTLVRKISQKISEMRQRPRG